MKELTPDHVRGDQLINGIWLRSNDIKNYLIEGNFSLSIGNNCVFIYGEYPIIVRRPPSEKVIFKNVSFHVHDDNLLNYIYSLPDMKVQTKFRIPARLRNMNRELTPYLSGNRFLYVRGDLCRVLPPIISIKITLFVFNIKHRILLAADVIIWVTMLATPMHVMLSLMMCYNTITQNRFE